MEKSKILVLALILSLLLNTIFILYLVNDFRISGFTFYENSDDFSRFVDENSIILDDSKVSFSLEEAVLIRYADSESMYPVINKNTIGVAVKPSVSDINLGDIVVFKKDEISIVHRVVGIGEDAEGIYFLTKGDNNNFSDGKVRFSEIEYLVVALIY